MPAYVFRYSTKDGPMKVEFTYVPDWKIVSREAAYQHFAALRSHGLYLKEHHCDFAVEELADGTFAIACTTHPEHLRTASTAVHAQQ
jgi:hypothetical protein